MKNIIIALLLALSHYSMAQQKMLLKVSLLGQQTHIDNKEDREEGPLFDYVNSYCLGASLNLNYYFSKHIYAGIGMMGVQHQQRFNSYIPMVSNPYEGSKRNTYLKVPIYIGYETGHFLKKLSFYQHIGIQNTFLVKADGAAVCYYDRTANGGSYYLGLYYPSNNYFKSYCIGMITEAGINFNLTEKFLISCAYFFDYHFSDAENKNTVLPDGLLLYKENSAVRPKTHLRSEAIVFSIGKRF
jgi:hypothetical protein